MKESAPAPRTALDFVRNIATTTIYCSHYDRMRAVIKAARTGDALLIKLALEFHDAHGCRDVDRYGAPIEHRDVGAIDRDWKLRYQIKRDNDKDRYLIIRVSDNQVVETNFYTEADAIAWLRDFVLLRPV